MFRILVGTIVKPNNRVYGFTPTDMEKGGCEVIDTRINASGERELAVINGRPTNESVRWYHENDLVAVRSIKDRAEFVITRYDGVEKFYWEGVFWSPHVSYAKQFHTYDSAADRAAILVNAWHDADINVEVLSK